MIRRAAAAAILGFLVLAVWTFVVNGVYGFTARLTMNEVVDEPAVHLMLTKHVTTPGAYIVNPPLTPNRRFPEGQPVFAVTYSGMGHEAAGGQMLGNLATALIVMLLAAGLLAAASARVLARWSSRVAFVIVLGVLQVLASDVPRIGIGGWPAHTAFAMAGFHLAGWTLAAFAIALVLRPAERRAVA